MRDELIQKITKQFGDLLEGFNKELKVKYVVAQGFGNWNEIILLPEEKLEELSLKLESKQDVLTKKLNLNREVYEDENYEIVRNNPTKVSEVIWRIKE